MGLTAIVGFAAVLLAMSTPALAATAPSAGGDRTVNEDTLTSFTGSDTSGTATSEGWVFDGNIVDGNPASWNFTTPGVYSAAYWADDGAGSNNSDTISVAVVDVTPPVADAGADQSVDEDTTVNFDGSGTTDNDPAFGSTARYYWLFWDGGSSVSLNGQTPSYSFATPGTYGVTLVVLDSAGNYGSDSMVVAVADVTAPSPAITGGSPQSVDEDAVVSFDASGTTDNDPSFGYTGTYVWTFTDGTPQTLTGKSTSYTFATPGSYVVTLNVTDAAGNFATASATFNILDVTDPVADWTISSGFTFDEDVQQTLDGTASSDNVAVSTYEWTIDYYGGSTTQYGSTTTFTWATPGVFDVTLTAYDAAGNSHAVTRTVTVVDVTNPTAVIAGGSPQNYDDGTTVTLDGTGSSDNDPNFGSSGTYDWDISGPVSTTLSGSSTSYTFSTPGTYTVTLYVTDAEGNVGSDAVTVNIADISPPLVSIASGPSTLEQFYSANHVGSASDDVGVTASGWAFTENSNPMNVSGSTLSRAWDFTGSYTLTFWASDAQGNIASTSMSFQVTPDATAPAITISGATNGDNKNAIALTGTINSELDPACSSSCTWTWEVTDRTGSTSTVATGTTSISYTFLPGRNTVTLTVTDPTGNAGVDTHLVDVDELVDVDTTWSSSLALNWDVTISAGATLLVQGAVVYEPTLVTTSTIRIADGRLIFDSAQLGFTAGGPNGFIIDGTPTSSVSNPTMLMYFNDSTIMGLNQPIFIQDGTLSATNSNFAELRSSGGGFFEGVDSSFFFTGVSIDASDDPDAFGILSTVTSAITFGTTKYIRLDGATVLSGTDAIRLETSDVGGSVDVFLRDTLLQAGSSADLGLRVDADGGSGDYTFDLLRVGTSSAPSSTVGATFSNRFSNTVDWTVEDAVFAGAAVAMDVHFLDTASTCSFGLTNVTARGSGGGLQLEFLNTQGGAPTWTVSNVCSVTMDDVHFDANSGSGVFVKRSSVTDDAAYTNFLSVDIAAQGSTFNNNGGKGIEFFQDYGYAAPYETAIDLSISLTDVQLNGNLAGLYWYGYYVRANMDVEMTRVQVDNNSDYGIYHYQYRSSEFVDLDHIGQYNFNISDSSIDNNGFGMYFWNYYLLGQQNFTFNIEGTSIDNGLSGGVYWYSYYLQYYRYQGDQSSDTHVFWTLDHSSVSNNSGAYGMYYYTYYCYGYSSDPGYCMYHLTLNATHVDDNQGQGLYYYNRYFYYNHGNTYLNILNGSTADRNGNYGIYTYCYRCEYGYNVAQGRVAPEFWVVVRDSSVSDNALDGLYVYFYYHYYGTGFSGMDIDGGTFERNGGDGVYFYNRYNMYGVGIKNTIRNSTLKDNLGNGYEAYYERQYNTCAWCVVEVVDNNHFEGNLESDILLGYPTSYYRSGGMWYVNYTNNVFVSPAKPAIKTHVTYTYSGSSADYSFGESVNISGNRITNASGAPIEFEMDPVGPAGGVSVVFNDNYIADAGDSTSLKLPGDDGARHSWTVSGNTILRNAGNALRIDLPNSGGGNLGSLTFERNRFEDTGASAFVLSQFNIQMSGSLIRDSVFINQRKAMELRGVDALVDNVTIRGSLQVDIELTDGQLEIHNTPVDTQKLKPVGTSATFNVYFHLKVDVVWDGSGDPALGSIVEIADALGITFYVGAIADDSGVPDLELWSYSMTVQGILGRSPFRVLVSFFEIQQEEVITLPYDKAVTIYLRDVISPTIVVSTPLDGASTRLTSMFVEGTAYDSQSGFQFDANDLQTAAVYVGVSSDGTTWHPVRIISADLFSVHFDYMFTDLDESVDNLYVRVTDAAGNPTVQSVRVTVDWTPPVVRLLEQVPDVTNAATVHVVAETEIGAEVLVNGLSPPELFIRPDGVHVYFQMDVPLEEGPNTVTVMAIDRLSNQGDASFFILVDRQAPYLAVLSPDADDLVNADVVEVSGQAYDRNGLVVTVNGEEVPIIDGNFSTTVQLVGAVNRIEVLATDTAGNTVLELRDVQFDDTPPWLTVQSPGQFAVLGSTAIDVVGIVEPGSTLIIGDEVVDAPTGAFKRRILLHEGQNEIHLSAIDAAGNVRDHVQTVTVDTVKPVIEITSPRDQTILNRQTVFVTGSASDEHSVSVTIDGGEIALNNDNTFSVPVALFEGTNFLRVVATDGAGNQEVIVMSIIRDTTLPYFAPLLEGTFFEGGITKTYGAAVALYGFAERGVVVEACMDDLDGTQVCNTLPLSGSGEFRTYLYLQAGEENTITVRATDAAGNSISRTFLVVQAPEPAPVEAGTPTSVFAAYGLAAALVGVGAYFMLFSRRGRGGRPVELEGGDGLAPVGELGDLAGENLEADVTAPAPGAADGAPPVGGETGAPTQDDLVEPPAEATPANHELENQQEGL